MFDMLKRLAGHADEGASPEPSSTPTAPLGDLDMLRAVVDAVLSNTRGGKANTTQLETWQALSNCYWDRRPYNELREAALRFLPHAQAFTPQGERALEKLASMLGYQAPGTSILDGLDMAAVRLAVDDLLDLGSAAFITERVYNAWLELEAASLEDKTDEELIVCARRVLRFGSMGSAQVDDALALLAGTLGEQWP
jgi:hypothetical protein